MTPEETAAAELAAKEAAAPGTSTTTGATEPPPGTTAGGAGAGKTEYTQTAVEEELQRLRDERKANKKPDPGKVETPADPSGAAGTGTSSPGTPPNAADPKPAAAPAAAPPGDFYRSMATGMVGMADYVFPRWSKWANNAPDHTPYKADAEQKEFLINAYEKFFRWLKLTFTPLHEFLFANFIVYGWRILYGLFFVRLPLWYKTRKQKTPEAAASRMAEEIKRRAAEAAKAAEDAAKGLHKCGWHECNEMVEEGKDFCSVSHGAKQREADKKAKAAAEAAEKKAAEEAAKKAKEAADKK